MILLKITYRLRAHHMAKFEQIFDDQIIPLAQEHNLRLWGIWRTVVGEVGEYMELWEFASLADFDENWHKLLKDPRLLEIFETTGPMVESERFAILEPAINSEKTILSKRLQV